MFTKRAKLADGVTLIEAMAAMAVLAIAALGALGYQYHLARHMRIARAQVTGIRTAQLLLEDWKSTGGSRDYDPASLGLGFSEPIKMPSQWSQGVGEGLGSPLHDAVYGISVDGFSMMVVLRWEDVSYDQVAEVTLRQLSVVVRFGDYSEQAAGGGVPSGSSSDSIWPVILSSYVRLDSSSG